MRLLHQSDAAAQPLPATVDFAETFNQAVSTAGVFPCSGTAGSGVYGKQIKT
jgi:hypothetical protein